MRHTSFLCRPSVFSEALRRPSRAAVIMDNPQQPSKRLKRENYRNVPQPDGQVTMPKKKFYRQRAHANPFSDHQLT